MQDHVAELLDEARGLLQRLDQYTGTDNEVRLLGELRRVLSQLDASIEHPDESPELRSLRRRHEVLANAYKVKRDLLDKGRDTIARLKDERRRLRMVLERLHAEHRTVPALAESELAAEARRVLAETKHND